MLLPEDYVVWDKEIALEDVPSVGNEIASMGEFSRTDIPTLPHIVITPSAFTFFKEQNNLNIQIKHLLGSLNSERHDSVSQVSSYIKKLVEKSEIPEGIYRPYHKMFDAFKHHKVTLKAHYFHNKKVTKTSEVKNLEGDAAVLEKVREVWAGIFTLENLSSYKMHHENHDEFTVCISLTPEYEFSSSGNVTAGSKGEFRLEAHTLVRLIYNKHSKRIVKAHVLERGTKDSLSVPEVKKLLDIAHRLEKIFYLPQIAYWGKLKNEFLVTRILPAGDQIDYKDTFNSLSAMLTVCPGVTIGKLRVIDEKTISGVILNDEIVVLKKLDKKMMETIKKAKGIILHENPEPEITELLKKAGIPTLVRDHKTLLYSTGDVISLNASTGEIKRGSMLVS